MSILSPDFSTHFCRTFKKCPENPYKKIPGKITPNFLQQESPTVPTYFCRGSGTRPTNQSSFSPNFGKELAPYRGLSLWRPSGQKISNARNAMIVWLQSRSGPPNAVAIISFLRSYLSPMSLLLGREPCGDRILRSCLQKASATAHSNYGNGPPDVLPSLFQVSIWHRFDINSTLIRHRFPDLMTLLQYQIDP